MNMHAFDYISFFQSLKGRQLLKQVHHDRLWLYLFIVWHRLIAFYFLVSCIGVYTSHMVYIHPSHPSIPHWYISTLHTHPSRISAYPPYHSPPIPYWCKSTRQRTFYPILVHIHSRPLTHQSRLCIYPPYHSSTKPIQALSTVPFTHQTRTGVIHIPFTHQSHEVLSSLYTSVIHPTTNPVQALSTVSLAH